MPSSSAELRRPTTVEEMIGRLEQFRTPEALERGMSLEARPDDGFISTSPKSGTTWLQQGVHGLRSAGSMDFEEISCVVPWLESALDIGIDPHGEQAWSPRAFKAHLEWERIPKGGRYVTALRDPKSVLPSFHRFLEGWFFEAGSITLEEFARGLFMAGSSSGRYWDHVRSWTPLDGREDVLVLTYEDMLAAPDAVPGVIADFLGLDVPAEVVSLVARQSSRTFMAEHAERFDEHVLREARDRVWGFPPGGGSTKVQSLGSRAEIDERLAADLDAIWRTEIESTLGFASYADLRASLPDPLGARS